jgi:hypothetical protein
MNAYLHALVQYRGQHDMIFAYEGAKCHTNDNIVHNKPDYIKETCTPVNHMVLGEQETLTWYIEQRRRGPGSIRVCLGYSYR